MQRIPFGICRHELMIYVCVNDLQDCFGCVEVFQVLNELESSKLHRIVTRFEFVSHGCTCY